MPDYSSLDALLASRQSQSLKNYTQTNALPGQGPAPIQNRSAAYPTFVDAAPTSGPVAPAVPSTSPGETGGFPDMMPTAAESAAKAAAAKSVADWNSNGAIATNLSGAGGVGTPQEVSALMGGPQPGWGKQAGMDAINQKGGAPRALNYGVDSANSTIIGSGSGSRGQANSFTGVQNKAPAQMSTRDTMHSQLADLNARQKMYSESGTLQGRLNAVALSKQAQRLSQQIYTEGMTQHAMGTLGLEQEKAKPQLAVQGTAIKQLLAGDRLGAYKTIATFAGNNPDAMHMMLTQLGMVGYNPNDPNGGVASFNMEGKPTGASAFPQLQPPNQPPTALPR